MLYKAFAKINWALNIVGRKDGFHLLDGVMENVDLYDEVSIEIVKGNDVKVEYLNCDDIQDDLCSLACDYFKRATGIEFGANISVLKHIPMGAGLGGGSSDCALVLFVLNTYFDYPLKEDELLLLGTSLGSDVPFFLMGGTQRARGKGEILEPISKSFTSQMLIVKPVESISTKTAFDLFDLEGETKNGDVDALIKGLSTNSPDLIYDNMVNDLEEASIKLLPSIQEIIDVLYEKGAKKAMMTGSGSAVIGLFEGFIPRSFPTLKNCKIIKTQTVDKSYEIISK